VTRLTCPHCNEPVAANPIGRWYSRFQCPHCHRMLQFDAVTNATGVAGSALFFVAAWSLMMGTSELAHPIAWIAGALWLALIGTSFALRRVVKG
jgi:hypothetical protein